MMLYNILNVLVKKSKKIYMIYNWNEKFWYKILLGIM